MSKQQDRVKIVSDGFLTTNIANDMLTSTSSIKTTLNMTASGNFISNNDITIGTNISGSLRSTASFGKLIGDGANIITDAVFTSDDSSPQLGGHLDIGNFQLSGSFNLDVPSGSVFFKEISGSDYINIWKKVELYDETFAKDFYVEEFKTMGVQAGGEHINLESDFVDINGDSLDDTIESTTTLTFVTTDALIKGDPVKINSDGTVSKLGNGITKTFVGVSKADYASSATAKIVLRGFTANVTGSLTPDGAGFITGSRYFIKSDGSYQTASIDLASGPVVAGNAIDGETITLRSIE